MAVNTELTEFVRSALATGRSRAEIVSALQTAGWPHDSIDDAMAGYAEVDFPIPVPKPKPYLSAREAFIYLLLFSMLYLSAFQVGVLLFHRIDATFADPSVQVNTVAVRGLIRWALATLFVAFPVFLYLSVVTERSVRQDPAKRRSQVRRWLMYLTTFVAASVLIGDVIALVYSALAGELTTRFVLKIATIALIGGLALLYYLSDLKLEDTRPSAAADRVRRPVTAFAIVIAVASASAGLYAVGRPADERMRRADDRRIDDLAAIEAAAAVYFKRHGRLPDSLDELGPEGGVKLERWDPSGTDYEYRVTAPHAYELCATFVRESEPGRNWRGADWAHGPGRVCFPKTVKQSTE